MPQNEEVARQWMMEQEAIANKKQYILNKRRQGLASNLNPGLLSSNGPERHKQLSDRIRSLTGPMYLDGKQIRNEIQSGLGIRPNYPTPELKMHQGEVHPMRQPVQQIGLLDNAKQSVRGLVPDAVRDGLMNAQTWMRGGSDELEQMRQDEDFRGTSYLDKTNTDSQTGRKRALTIGYGFNMDQAGAEKTMRKAGITKNWGDLRSGKSTLTKAEGLALQNVAYAGYAKSAMNFAGGQSWNIMSGDQRNALINLVSNMGSGKLNKSFPSMRREMRSGNFARAAHELMVDKGGVNPSAYALQVGDRATRIASRLSGQPEVQPQHIGGGQSTVNMDSQFGAPQTMPSAKPVDATMTLTKPFPGTNAAPEPEAAYQQPQPNLGFAQRSGGTYSDDEMQRMVALSQQLQNNYTA